MWVLDHLDDIESDMSVFHRVDDIYTMRGSLFFARAVRLPAYDGVMRARVAEESERGRSEYEGQPVKRMSVEELAGSPNMAGIISVKKVGDG